MRRLASSTCLAKPRSPDGERGFALSEVLISILIIGAALLTLLAASASSFSLQEVARQRQTAVGIANEVMERIRALDYTLIRAGSETNTSVDPTHVKSCGGVARLMQCTVADGFGEKILSTGSPSGSCPVALPTGSLAPTYSPLAPNCTEYVSNGVKYRAYAFVTKESTRPYRVTVIVDWPNPNPERSVTLQSMIPEPIGCTGTVTRSLVSGPCGAANVTTATIPGPAITVADALGHSVSIDLGSLTLSWDEPVSGERELRASMGWPTVSGSGTVVNWSTIVTDARTGRQEGNALMVRDSVDSTDTLATGGTQYAGILLPAATAPTVYAGKTLASAPVQVLDPTTLVSGTRYLVLTWTGAANCGATAPSGYFWFTCAEIDAEATASSEQCLGTTSPCVRAVLNLPSVDVCLRKVLGACAKSGADAGTDTVMLANLDAGGLASGTFTLTSRATSRAFPLGVGFINYFGGTSTFAFPTAPLTKAGLPSDNRSYDPIAKMLSGGPGTYAAPYLYLKTKASGSGTTPTDCSQGSNYATPAPVYAGASDPQLTHCYLSTSVKQAHAVTVPSGGVTGWSWYACATLPTKSEQVASVCSRLVALSITVDLRTTSIVADSTGGGW